MMKIRALFRHAAIWSLVSAATVWAEPSCTSLDLPVLRTEPPPGQYRLFCAAYPAQCDLRGAAVLTLTPEAERILSRVNQSVNLDITLTSDIAEYGKEELWTLPLRGYGDCEDLALEKRRRLAEAGLPSAAFTMAIVHHETRFFAHAVLMAETDLGTLVLDNLNDLLLCWDAPPFDFERRERPDGSWQRFVRPN